MVALVELELPNVQESVSIGLYDRLKPAPLWHVEDLFGLLPPDGNSLLLDQGGSGTNDPRAKEEAIASVRYQRWSDLEQWCRTLVLDFLLLAAMLVVAYRCQQPRLTRSLLTLLLPLQHARTALYRSQLSCRGLCGGWLRGRQFGCSRRRPGKQLRGRLFVFPSSARPNVHHSNVKVAPCGIVFLNCF